MSSYTTISSHTPPNTHAASDLQHHLYAAFLEQKTADVALRIRGSWHAIYKLHRVILIQAGFFKSLFTSGFVESRTRYVPHRDGPDEVEIIFDDPNITRAAFEICISRLYGGGPPLHLAPELIPTPNQPLTPAMSSETLLNPSPCPSTHHPATPRFLLSLLATAVFLSIPSVASSVLTYISNTVGPSTVVRYLNFAIGKGIGECDEDEPIAAVGLESVAEIVEEDDRSIITTDTQQMYVMDSLLEGVDNEKGGELNIKKENPLSDHASLYPSAAGSVRSFHNGLNFFYGGISDKVGEAAMCWLTRWGLDILQYEEPLVNEVGPPNPPEGSTSTGNRKRAVTIPSLSKGRTYKHSAPKIVVNQDIPSIWRQGGLDAKWARLVLSSDALFVKGEKERYNMARRVVELRRRVAISDEDEEQWKLLFERGIYYANMSFEDLLSIQKDTCSVTGKPFVPPSVLQSSHWDQSVLRHHITFRPPSSSSPPQSPSARGKELGVARTTAELIPLLVGTEVTDVSKGNVYFPVPVDSSSRIGDTAGLDGATMDQLFDLSSSRSSTTTSTSGLSPTSTSESNAFGLEQQCYTVADCIKHDPSGKRRWSPYPPIRFGVEYWDVDSLKEKSRLHSHTVWYAGSLWNVYVQVVRKKGVQLGVYLHRQSSVDPIPPSSAPVPLSSSFGIPLRPVVSFPDPTTIGMSMSRSSTPQSTRGSSSTPTSPSRPSSLPNSSSMTAIHASANGVSATIPATAPPVMPAQPYRDPRSEISAYFTISCASATGSNLTRFTSAPDTFSVSQSWGWKSSSLRTEEYLDVSEDGVGRGATQHISLRATIVLGLI
ncbi:hypothetical protein C8Q75DRAFT_713058 [Abortiporus biennis]|nr:hypothetical protein C8Q75DRAFT_713058 [Abortiporus biennis]